VGDISVTGIKSIQVLVPGGRRQVVEDGRWKVEGGKVEGGMWNVMGQTKNDRISGFVRSV
jgi:hypothetical protein